MTAEQYLKESTRSIYNSQARAEVWKELNSCIEDLTQSYMENGMTEQEAEAAAVEQMGEPMEAGTAFRKVYRPKVEWKEILWFAAWTAVFGAFHFLGIHFHFDFINHYPGIFRGIGVFFMIFGICWSAVEKYMDLPFLYAWANNWGASGLGGLANAGLIGAIGTGIAAGNVTDLFLLAIVMILLFQGQRMIISRLREKKEQKYLWELCTAQEAFDYKGKVRTPGNEALKVRIKNGDLVKNGDIVMITGIDGFMLLAEKANA